uniref:glutathione transferase n=1 Tax=Caenorhabditis tropicalis TaxID=1561998 RepID=A0A1I7TDA7_9PELO
MVHYKLTYFDARGLAETARQLFVLADVEFEDNRLTIEEFQKLKPTLPSGQVPILHVDGFEISQSAAIWRYLARKFGYSGKTPEEEATADSIIDHFKDFLVSFKHYGAGLFFGKSQEELNRVRKEIVEPACKFYFSVLKKYLEKNTSGYLVGSDLTYADIAVAENLTSLKNTNFFNPDEEKTLAAFHQKVNETPKLKEYLEKRKYSIL